MTSRRDILRAAAAATPYVLTAPGVSGLASAAENRSKTSAKPPGPAGDGSQIRIGLIGAGTIGVANMKIAKPWLDIRAVADVDRGRAERFNETVADGRATIVDDYRRMLDRQDIDAIHIATPDHWHAKPLIESMVAGKAVYCEKPLTLTIVEGRWIQKVQRRTGAVVQVGTQQRSDFRYFVKAIAMVADGRLGRLRRVRAAIGGGPYSSSIPTAAPPDGFDWDRWLGPAAWVDRRDGLSPAGEHQSNHHHNFRWWYQFSGGKLTDWGAHHVDICHWALKVNGQTKGPTRVSGTAEHPMEFDTFGNPMRSDRYNTATEFRFAFRYPGDTEMIVDSDPGKGVLLEGDRGRIFVNRGKLVGKPVAELQDRPLPDEVIDRVYRGAPRIRRGAPRAYNGRLAHWFNFLHAVKDGTPTISDVDSHLEALNLCHLAGLCGRLGRPIRWDPDNARVIDDPIAAAMMSRPYRRGYGVRGL